MFNILVVRQMISYVCIFGENESMIIERGSIGYRLQLQGNKIIMAIKSLILSSYLALSVKKLNSELL